MFFAKRKKNIVSESLLRMIYILILFFLIEEIRKAKELQAIIVNAFTDSIISSNSHFSLSIICLIQHDTHRMYQDRCRKKEKQEIEAH